MARAPAARPQRSGGTNSRGRVEATLISTGERFGWIYTSLWLVFLGFPLGSLVAGDKSVVAKLVGVGLVVVFAGVYVVANHRLEGLGERSALGYLVTLAGLALLATPVFGIDALAFVPYLCAWTIFALPVRWGVAVAAVSVLLPVVLGAVVTPRAMTYSIIVGSVAIATGAVASFIRSGRRTNELRLRRGLASDQERVARDVHDVLGHSLTAVVVKSELAQRLIVDNPERAWRELVDIEALSRAALAEIRATVDGLRATRFADEVDTARHLLTAAGIKLEVPGDIAEVDPTASVVLAWAVREATTNIARHSGARSATIRWGRNWVEITDDGRGIGEAGDTSRAGERRGAGLTGLRERVVAMGGSLVVEVADDGNGTRVRATAGAKTR